MYGCLEEDSCKAASLVPRQWVGLLEIVMYEKLEGLIVKQQRTAERRGPQWWANQEDNQFILGIFGGFRPRSAGISSCARNADRWSSASLALVFDLDALITEEKRSNLSNLYSCVWLIG